ncbi:hypothetical protein AMEX_G26218 [Astyanax mexicanus]|uniref:Uncharacterized protein n=1 Tax=Astyanax mexicanus TaxID=7994 RepID=A0A8T2KRH7_ASTMX|nr:hypothetical protein AMEX_G26218 [Astyanax mexicanus]
MILECKKTIRLFSMVCGKTMDSEKAFLKDLRRSSKLCEVKTLEESHFIIAFVPVVSRAGTDIEAALDQIPESRPVVLVVLHYTFAEDFLAPDSSGCVNRENVFTVDCVFNEDRGLLRCHRNDEALKAVKKHLEVDEDKTMDDNFTSTEHPSLTQQYPSQNRTSVCRPQNQTCSRRTLVYFAVILFLVILVTLIVFLYVSRDSGLI